MCGRKMSMLVYLMCLILLALGSQSHLAAGEDPDTDSLNYAPGVDVECSEHGVVIIVNAPSLEEAFPSLQGAALQAGYGSTNVNCSARAQGESIFMNFRLRECNPLVYQTKTHTTYRYAISGQGETNVHIGSKKSASGRLYVDCTVPTKNVAYPLDSHTTIQRYGDGSESVTLSMGLYSDEQFTEAIYSGRIEGWRPISVLLRLDSDAEGYRPIRRSIAVRSCWASPLEVSTVRRLYWIKDGCFTFNDSTFTVLPVERRSDYGFRYDAFQFKDAGSDIWIKCEVQLCSGGKTSSGTSCWQTRDCSELEDLRHDDYECSRPYTIQHGPFQVTGLKSRQAGNLGSTEEEITEVDGNQIKVSPVHIVLAGVLIIALSVVVIKWGPKKAFSVQGYKPTCNSEKDNGYSVVKNSPEDNNDTSLGANLNQAEVVIVSTNTRVETKDELVSGVRTPAAT